MHVLAQAHDDGEATTIVLVKRYDDADAQRGKTMSARLALSPRLQPTNLTYDTPVLRMQSG